MYCLGVDGDTRSNIKAIYDFKTGNVKTDYLLFMVSSGNGFPMGTDIPEFS